MAPYYKSLTSMSNPVIPLDASLLAKMEETNKTELESFDKRLEEAEKTEGETEVSDILRARANYLTRIGDIVRPLLLPLPGLITNTTRQESAITALKTALAKTPGLGSKIDITLTIARIGFFINSESIISTHLTDAEKLIEKGGDWDRRNRLKVYNGVHAVSIRQFGKAGELFSDALSTFTASELVDYEDFVGLAVIANMVSLGRVDLKAKVPVSSYPHFALT